jgi:AcrR family transcriptional regulator
MMGKGQETRQAIVTRAIRLASIVGLEGVTIGRLAEELKLSKSGLFAHFRSKENLQVEAVHTAAELFLEAVMVPTEREPQGIDRVRAFFDNWLAWGDSPAGCFFVSAAVELDDQPGPARDALVKAHRDLRDALTTAAQIAVEKGHFRPDLDAEQFAFELYGIVLSAHHFHRFVRDPDTLARTRTAFERLVSDAEV